MSFPLAGDVLSHAIEVRGVTKTFGPKVAVRDLDLVVPTGSMYGFIGPNGAGKTTTIRMVMSILFPDRGEISVLGHASALEAKDRIGYLPEERGVYKKMKVGAFLTYMARLKGADERGLRARVRQWLERVDLAEIESKRCEELSKGMQQKIQFVCSVIHEPDLLILDEPFSGLDPVNMRLLRELIREQHKRGATIIFSTHVMYQAEQICEHVVMINDGDKVLDDSLMAIGKRFDPRMIYLEPLDQDAAPDGLRGVAGVLDVSRSNGRFEVSLDEGSDPSRVMQQLVSILPPAKIELHRPTLEDVFVEIVTGTGKVPGTDLESLRASVRADPHAAEEVGG
jgi:ABC-2 type transport system ATP-binding protein